ncbi:MAG: hypothetical protein FJY29_08620 [Betaproteobacteria bacterium]|nr:hypothetical protein [Betaproteobacteria bacterium]
MVRLFGLKTEADYLARVMPVCASLAFIACETSPPQVRTAVPITWGESNTLQLSSQTDAMTQPWRKIVVLTRGVLTIGLQSNSDASRMRLNVKNETGKRSIFQKDIELAPRSPLNITLNVDAGTYYMVLEPLEGQAVNAALAARFQPEDPDALSGADKGREGAQQLVTAQAKEGAVSFRDGNRTDWFRYDASTAETLQIRFQTIDQAKGVKAECITPTGLSFELTGQDKLVLREAGTVWFRVFADQADSGGGYKLTTFSSPFLGTERKGLILKFNGQNATINMGTEDGVREGLKGYIQRPDGTLVDFVIDKALQRSSSAKSATTFKQMDLNLTVHFERK